MLDQPGGGERCLGGGALVALAAILALYAVALRAYFVPTLGGPDANSYHVAARMVAEHGRFYQSPEDDLSFVGRMWGVNERGEYYSKYPPLYPALAGAAMRLFGDLGGLCVAPVCSWLAVLGAFLLCRAFLPTWASVLGALVAATNPLFNMFAADQVSHPASVAFLTWGYAAFFHGAHAERERRRGWLFLAAGFLLGYAVGIRYTNLLLVLPPLLWLALGITRSGRGSRGALLAGLAIPGAFLAWFHWTAYGSPLRTGYSLTDEHHGFGLAYFVHNLRFYVAFLSQGIGPVFVLAACGFVLAWARDWRRGLFFLSWLGPVAALYVSYYYLPELAEGYLRFLLPLVMPCTLLALAFLWRVLAGFEGATTRRLLVGAVIASQAVWGVVGSLEQFELRYAFNDMQHRKVEFIRQSVPAGSVVFCPFWILDSLDYHRAYSMRDADLLRRERLTSRVEHFLSERYVQPERGTRWNAELVAVDDATYRQRIRASIDGPLAEGRGVYVIGTPEETGALLAAYADEYRLQEVARLPRLEPRHRVHAARFHGPLTSAWDTTVVTRIRAREAR